MPGLGPISSPAGRLVRLAAGALLLAAPAGAQTVPVADAGPDQVVDCAAATGADVALDGSASFDPDDAAALLTFTWTGAALPLPVDGAMPTVSLPPGEHVLTLTVDDAVDGAASDDVTISVSVDADAPTIELSLGAATLWPPNHKYHVFPASDFVASVSDACDGELSAADVVFAGVVSDEEEDGRGDGSTTADVVFTYGCDTALIRAERQGPGDGRVYEATLAVADAAGNAGEAVVTVSVPKSQGQGGAAVDSGDVYEVLADTCRAVDLCPPVPAPDCLPAQEGKLQLRSGGRDRMSWTARDIAATEDELGDGEAGTDYQVCLYVDDGSTAGVEADPAAPGGRSWKRSRGGQSFRARGSARAAGIQKVKLRSRGGDTDVKLKARGEGLDLPELPVDDGATVIVQLWNSEGTCFESVFDDPHVNKPGRYKAMVR